jgi:hypothetical protein
MVFFFGNTAPILITWHKFIFARWDATPYHVRLIFIVFCQVIPKHLDWLCSGYRRFNLVECPFTWTSTRSLVVLFARTSLLILLNIIRNLCYGVIYSKTSHTKIINLIHLHPNALVLWMQIYAQVKEWLNINILAQSLRIDQNRNNQDFYAFKKSRLCYYFSKITQGVIKQCIKKIEHLIQEAVLKAFASGFGRLR